VARESIVNRSVMPCRGPLQFFRRRTLTHFVLSAVMAVTLQGCATSRPVSDGPEVWQHRFAAHWKSDIVGAAHDLSVIAERWPDTLPQYSDEIVYSLFNRLGHAPAEQQAQLDLLRQLYAGHWTMQCGRQPSFFWLKFVQQLVDRNELKLAHDVVTHVRGPKEVLILRVDKRYMALAATDSSLPTVEEAAVQDIDQARAAVQRCPRSLYATTRLVSAMLTAGRNEAALEAANEAIVRIVDKPTSYDDVFDYASRLLETRADALSALAHWSEAEETYRKSIGMYEKGHPNVSQQLDFALFLLRMGRVDDAQRVIGPHVTVDFRTDQIDGVSPYGAMVFARAKLQGSLLANDDAAAELVFAYLKRHRQDSQGIYRNALILTHRTDDYAQALVEDLRDPFRRADTLVGIQDYEHLPRPPGSIDFRPEVQAALHRTEVQQAIHEVGSIQTFEIPGDFY
jgi:tetratricopeptide (TPR) repeat protein